jgi:phage terminase large subunit
MQLRRVHGEAGMELTIPYKFKPRPYQLPLLKAFDNGYTRAVQVWHRRAGKEKTDLNLMVKKMLERVGSYYYIFPELTQGRKILWDGADKDGFRFLDHIPKEIIYGKRNETEMKVRIKRPGTNEPGSMLQIVGSDRYNSVMGTNPVGIIFSEYSLQDPTCWAYFRPILAENGGWAIFNFTPRGENHAYDLYALAKAEPQRWFTSLLTVDDTKAVSQTILDQERREIVRLYGNDALFLQEYYCSFQVPIAGAYYADNIQAAYAEGRIRDVPHEPRLTVDTWWDLGINDKMCIWFTQSFGAELRVIDYLEDSGKGLPHYIKALKDKPYVYGMHTAPHDIEVRELTSGKSRRDTAASLGINFRTAPKLPKTDQIDAVRAIFGRCYFDQVKCKDGLNALKCYHKQWDDKRKCYLNTPYHDWSSNGADAFATMASSLDFKHHGKPTEQADKYEKARARRLRADEDNLMGVFG